MNLFEEIYNDKKPLAHKFRPKKLEDFKGQDHLIGEKGIIYKIIKNRNFVNSIFWGPSGTGKTTLAEIISHELNYNYKYLNAIKSSVSDIKDISKESQNIFSVNGKQTLLFLDEIHRFNKLQQDSLLEDLERGNIILIGATTENPYYNLNNALLSRTLSFEFKKLSEKNIFELLEKINVEEKVYFNKEILEYISEIVEGDGRKAINILEILIKANVNLSLEEVKEMLSIKKSYHKTEDKYNTISALIKSIRGSDPDASVYWLAKMLSGGEDPLYIARRLLILASEDIGLANPQALTIATSAMTATKEIGMPEIRIILSEVVIYLALSPKSNSVYLAINNAINHVQNERIQEVPHHLTDLGRKDYKYPHDYENNFIKQKYMNEKIKFYEFGNNKFELALKERQKKLWEK